MMIKKLFFFSLVLLAAACSSDSEDDLFADDGNGGPDPCATEVSFENEVADILAANCNIPTCHNGDLGASRDWRDLSAVQSRAQSIRTRTSARTMPPDFSGITLTQDQINTIACWVQQGAQDN